MLTAEQKKFIEATNLIVAKHLSLNIQPKQYAIAGDNLLNSISKVLEVLMDSELIAAWAVAYQQFAGILIAGEKAKDKAGQYISIRVTVAEIGHKQPRQYTLSNTFNEQV